MSDISFTKDNVDGYLKELAKEFRKMNGTRMPAEIILTGGASVSAEYLAAMKLMAGRQYKNDLSDVVGILLEQQKIEKPITLDCIKRAAMELYDGYDKLPESSKIFIEAVFQNSDLEELYEKVRADEKQNKDILLEFQEDYPDVLNGDNLAAILKAARVKREKIKKDNPVGEN